MDKFALFIITFRLIHICILIRSDSTMKLALFDLDNTLIAGDSDCLWGEFLSDMGILIQKLTNLITKNTIRTI